MNIPLRVLREMTQEQRARALLAVALELARLKSMREQGVKTRRKVLVHDGKKWRWEKASAVG